MGVASDKGAEAAEDALDLALLFHLGLAPGVAQLDDGQGLHEDGGAAGGDVVDDALHLAAHLGLDGDDVAAVAQGDYRLLDDAASVRRVDQLLELGLEAVVDGAEVAADDGESGTGAVDDFGARG